MKPHWLKPAELVVAATTVAVVPRAVMVVSSPEFVLAVVVPLAILVSSKMVSVPRASVNMECEAPTVDIAAASVVFFFVAFSVVIFVVGVVAVVGSASKPPLAPRTPPKNTGARSNERDMEIMLMQMVRKKG